MNCEIAKHGSSFRFTVSVMNAESMDGYVPFPHVMPQIAVANTYAKSAPANPPMARKFGGADVSKVNATTATEIRFSGYLIYGNNYS